MENEDKVDQPETTPEPDLKVQLFFLKSKMAANEAAANEQISRLAQELENERVNSIVVRAAMEEQAFAPDNIRLLVQGDLKRQGSKVYVGDVEFRSYLRQMKQSDEGWNLFRDSFAERQKNGGKKPADPVDVRHLTGEQYRQLRLSNPSAIGLRPKK